MYSYFFKQDSQSALTIGELIRLYRYKIKSIKQSPDNNTSVEIDFHDESYVSIRFKGKYFRVFDWEYRSEEKLNMAINQKYYCFNCDYLEYYEVTALNDGYFCPYCLERVITKGV